VKVLVVEHERATPLGLIGDWLAERGGEVDLLPIDVESREVDVRDYGLVVSLGSEFAAYDDSLEWLAPEIRLFRDALDADVPILGVCFGGQLLARVIGGSVYRGQVSEIGWLPVRSRDPDLVPEGPWFQWHFDTFSLPPDATLLAENDCGPQAFAWGRSLGVQFHPEVTPAIMDAWVRVYRHELEAEQLDPDALLEETQRLAGASRDRALRLLDRYFERVAGMGEAARGR
jgi:GMP synthase-like glutamine amidotransferase